MECQSLLCRIEILGLRLTFGRVSRERTQLMMTIAFHPQMDGQSERTIQVLEDMLRACVLDLKGSWDEHFPLVEFSYNNSYQVSI